LVNDALVEAMTAELDRDLTLAMALEFQEAD
jgi:hypothetical protein